MTRTCADVGLVITLTVSVFHNVCRRICCELIAQNKQNKDSSISAQSYGSLPRKLSRRNECFRVVALPAPRSLHFRRWSFLVSQNSIKQGNRRQQTSPPLRSLQPLYTTTKSDNVMPVAEYAGNYKFTTNLRCQSHRSTHALQPIICPLCVNMTSSTKPEVHNILHCCR